MVKMCKHQPDKRCYHKSCSLIDEFGNVSVCPLFRGGDFFASRKVVSGVRPLFSKHLRGGH